MENQKNQKEKKELSDIHFRIPKDLKADWKKRFKEKGQNTLSAGITAAVFNYLYLPGLNMGNMDDFIGQIRNFLQAIETIDTKLNDKVKRVETIDYPLPEIKVEIYDDIKQTIIDKLKIYQPISITFLTQLLSIPGEKLLAILTKMRDEKLIDYTKNYEWKLT